MFCISQSLSFFTHLVKTVVLFSSATHVFGINSVEFRSHSSKLHRHSIEWKSRRKWLRKENDMVINNILEVFGGSSPLTSCSTVLAVVGGVVDLLSSLDITTSSGCSTCSMQYCISMVSVQL